MYTCKCCEKEYELTGGYEGCYTLCNPCFNRYDNQKMNGRFKPLLTGEPFPPKEEYTESSDEFAESGRCTHEYVDNRMHNFYGSIRS